MLETSVQITILTDWRGFSSNTYIDSHWPTCDDFGNSRIRLDETKPRQCSEDLRIFRFHKNQRQNCNRDQLIDSRLKSIDSDSIRKRERNENKDALTLFTQGCRLNCRSALWADPLDVSISAESPSPILFGP